MPPWVSRPVGACVWCESKLVQIPACARHCGSAALVWRRGPQGVLCRSSALNWATCGLRD
eukprot:10417522-Alexandrium_andersonii.AAC.2